MQTILLLTLISCAIVHLMMASVMFLFSRHRVQYLSLGWVLCIFGIGFSIATPFAFAYHPGSIGLLHPVMLLALVATSYLQSIWTLGISMPGYLQWGRMWKYATPAIVLIIIYLIGLLSGSRPVILQHASELPTHLLNGDVLLRLLALGLAIYYIINIYRLPHSLVKNINLPGFIKGYGTAMGLATIYYVVVTVLFNMTLLLVYLYVFTVLNMYMFYRTLESMALRLPKPEIRHVDAAPEPKVIEQVEKEDFNEANLQRFQRTEFFMQTKREWTDNTFGRDRLCEVTGINRHLMLQCLRSQGYNNIHDYINSYRINELKSLIRNGRITNLNECVDAGFGSVKTARSCFERMEGLSLDAFLSAHRRTE
ncbi:MAG: hypothetical protein NC388_08970 [Clostridium sp.]|nr:hypothetical protein [Clostridium sp.]